MNTRFMKNFAFDLFIIWPALALSVFGSGALKDAAENLIGFIGVACLIFGVLGIFLSAPVAKSIFEKKTPTPRTNIHKNYSILTSVVEVVLCASLGWVWVASGFLIYAFSNALIDEEIKKLDNESVDLSA